MESLYNLGVIVSIIDKMTGPIKQMTQCFTNFENKIQKGKALTDYGNKLTVSGALVSGAAVTTGSALKNMLKPVMDVETAMGEMSSVGVKDLQALLTAAQNFSSQWSGTTEAQFISAAYDIKGGINSLSDTAVAEYTRMAALTGKATKSTTQEMTSLFATGYGIYKSMYSKMDDIKFGEMFGSGITAAVQQFKSTGPQMAQALTNLGATATSAKRPFEEQLAVLGMLQATMPGGEAGTKYRAFVQSAAGAGKQLGLSFVDQNNNMLGMIQILEKLRGKYGETLDAMESQQIKKAFGSDEAVALIDLLYPKIGELRQGIDVMGESMHKGNKYVEDIARTMNTGLGEQVQQVTQNIDILKRSMGQELAPVIKEMIPHIRNFVTWFLGFTKAHPTLTRTILMCLALAAAIFTILAPILIVGGGMMMMGGYFMQGLGIAGRALMWFGSVGGGAFKILYYSLGFLGNSLGALGPKLLAFGSRILPFLSSGLRMAALRVVSLSTTLLACPAFWIIAAIIAICAAIYLLWRNWDTVSAKLGQGWDWIKQKWMAVKTWFAGIFQSLIALAIQYGPMILAVLFPIIGIPLLIRQHWDQIKLICSQALDTALAWITGKIDQWRASGAALISSFTAGIRSMINQPIELVRGALASLRRMLPFSDAKEGPLSTLTKSGKAFINTFAWGIQNRAPYLQSVAGAALALGMPSGGGMDLSWGTSPLKTPSVVNIRQVIKETTMERESTSTRDRRPVIIYIEHKGEQLGIDDVINLAYQQLEARGE